MVIDDRGSVETIRQQKTEIVVILSDFECRNLKLFCHCFCFELDIRNSSQKVISPIFSALVPPGFLLRLI